MLAILHYLTAGQGARPRRRALVSRRRGGVESGRLGIGAARDRRGDLGWRSRRPGDPERTASLARAAPVKAGADWRVLLVAGDDSVRNFDRAVLRYGAAVKAAGVGPDSIKTLSALAKSEEDRPTEERIDALLSGLTAKPGGACLVIRTSHGSPRGMKFRVAGTETNLAPDRLAQILDRTCDRRPTVVVVSACYSGVFIDTRLQADHRIVLTAAHRTRQSFGCSSDFDVPIYDKCALQHFSGNRYVHDWARRIAACVAEREDGERIRRGSFPQAHFGKAVEQLAFLAE